MVRPVIFSNTAKALLGVTGKQVANPVGSRCNAVPYGKYRAMPASKASKKASILKIVVSHWE